MKTQFIFIFQLRLIDQHWQRYLLRVHPNSGPSQL